MASVVHEILEVLVKKWGYEHVRKCLTQVEHPNARATSHERSANAPRTKKPSAVDLVFKMEANEPKRAVLLELAKRFDEKSFLPRLGDVRHFLEMKGKETRSITQRPESFRVVLSLLKEMQADGIDRVLKDRSYSGPARLGPLSKAINEASMARNRNDPPSNQSNESKTEYTPNFTHPSSAPR